MKNKKRTTPQAQSVLFLQLDCGIAFPLNKQKESEEVRGCSFVDLAVRQGCKCMQWWKADSQFRHQQTRQRQRPHLNFLGDWGLCRPVPLDLMSSCLKKKDSQDPGAFWRRRRRRKRKRRKKSPGIFNSKSTLQQLTRKEKKKLSEKCF